jgi:hypothetical protein
LASPGLRGEKGLAEHWRHQTIEKQQQLSPKTWTIFPGVVHRQEQPSSGLSTFVQHQSRPRYCVKSFPILRKSPSGEKCDGKSDRKIGAAVAAEHPEVERGNAT